MVTHWKKVKEPGARRNMFINALGAVATGLTVMVVLIAKFVEGAWITTLLIPALLILMLSVRRYSEKVEQELKFPSPLKVTGLKPPVVIMPIQWWGKASAKALRFALTISQEIEAVHVEAENETPVIDHDWNNFVLAPLREQELPLPILVILKSPYRHVISPIVDYVLRVEDQHPGRQIAVVVPELFEHHWYHYLLRDNGAELLKALLLLKGDQRIVIVNVPWHLSA